MCCELFGRSATAISHEKKHSCCHPKCPAIKVFNQHCPRPITPSRYVSPPFFCLGNIICVHTHIAYHNSSTIFGKIKRKHKKTRQSRQRTVPLRSSLQTPCVERSLPCIISLRKASGALNLRPTFKGKFGYDQLLAVILDTRATKKSRFFPRNFKHYLVFSGKATNLARVRPHFIRLPAPIRGLCGQEAGAPGLYRPV